ncbi:hypothetical protein BVI1335_1630014 [Burkholderia vietnamiensis]|nr:hypothetical protein BVI1335_1630014 [Burkholderia vietnamiensis]
MADRRAHDDAVVPAGRSHGGRGRCLARQRAPHPHQLHADPRDDFGGLERLDDVIDAADLEPFDALVQFAGHRQEDHRDRARQRVGRQPPARGEPVHARHPHVHQHEIGQQRLRALARLHAVVRDADPAPGVAQKVDQQAQLVGLIVGDQDMGIAQYGCRGLHRLPVREVPRAALPCVSIPLRENRRKLRHGFTNGRGTRASTNRIGRSARQAVSRPNTRRCLFLLLTR